MRVRRTNFLEKTLIKWPIRASLESCKMDFYFLSNFVATNWALVWPVYGVLSNCFRVQIQNFKTPKFGKDQFPDLQTLRSYN